MQADTNQNLSRVGWSPLQGLGKEVKMNEINLLIEVLGSTE
jgi:hypothetical protein